MQKLFAIIFIPIYSSHILALCLLDILAFSLPPFSPSPSSSHPTYLLSLLPFPSVFSPIVVPCLVSFINYINPYR